MNPPPNVPRPTIQGFLFTDIEGSTRLLARAPDQFPEVMAIYRSVMREVVAQHGGDEVDNAGDGFQFVFSDPAHAIDAALAAQLRMRMQAWPGAPVRVRMGVHVGAALMDAGRFLGLAVHQASRTCDAGHGGQILLSADACAHAGPGHVLVDLGRFQLKDIEGLHSIFQLVHPDLPREFPPLRTPSETRHNLPARRTSLVGRDADVTAIAALLRDEALVTLVGTAGCGKTSLAVEVARGLVVAHRDGVTMVELAAITDPDQVPSAIAMALDLAEPASSETISERVRRHLSGRELLLVLDNCEHVLDAVAELVHFVLPAAHHLRVLATSREALRLPEETAWRVPSLEESAAIQLFSDRARRARDGFEIDRDNHDQVLQICRRLDGIPLAIELAAAEMAAMTPGQISARLDDFFRLLVGGSRTAMGRQQTLRAAVDWSHGLLTEPERILLRRLSVFVGGCTLEAAEAVAGLSPLSPLEIAPLLSGLAAKSLVVVETEGQSVRFDQLEMIRQYGRGKLVDAGEAAQVRDAHLTTMESIAITCASDRQDTVGALGRLREDEPNLRAALGWALEGGSAASGVRLLTAARDLWFAHGLFAEGYSWLSRLLGSSEVAVLDRARALATMGALATEARVDSAEVISIAEQALAAGEEAGDSVVQADALLLMAQALDSQGRADEAAARADRAVEIARAGTEEWHLAEVLDVHASHSFVPSRVSDSNLSEAMEIARRLGLSLLADLEESVASRLRQAQEFVAARPLLERVYKERQRRPSRLARGEASLAWGTFLYAVHQVDQARRILGDALALGLEIDRASLIHHARNRLAWCAVDEYEPNEVDELLAREAQANLDWGTGPMNAWHHCAVGDIRLLQLDYAAAEEAYRAGLALPELETPWLDFLCSHGIAQARTGLGDLESAHEFAWRAMRAARLGNNPGNEARGYYELGRHAVEHGDLAGAAAHFEAAMEIVRAHDLEWRLPSPDRELSGLAFLHGDMPKSLRHAGYRLEGARRRTHVDTILALVALANVRREMDEPGLAATATDEALEVCRGVPERSRRADRARWEARLMAATLALDALDWKAAAGHLDHLYDVPHVPPPDLAASHLLLRARLSIGLGLADGGELLRGALATRRAHGWRWYFIDWLEFLGTLHSECIPGDLAVRSLAAAAAERARRGCELSTRGTREHDAAVTRLRARVPGFAEAWSQGAAMDAASAWEELRSRVAPAGRSGVGQADTAG